MRPRTNAMTLKDVCHMFFSFCFVLFIISSPVVLCLNFKRTSHRWKTTDNVVSSLSARSKIECSAFCASEPACLSLFFSAQTGSCLLVAAILCDDQMITTTDDYRYYIISDTTSRTPVCPDGYDQAYCTKHYTNMVSRTDAISQCALDGGHLMEIANSCMHNYIINQLLGSTSRDVWIDGIRCGGDSDYCNRNGDPLPYIMWGPVEPDGGMQQCLRLANYTGWMFHDVRCSPTVIAFICQVP